MRLARRVLLALCLCAAALYLGLCGLLFTRQRALLYHPPAAYQSAASDVTLSAATGKVVVSTRPAPGPEAVIFYGGNAGDVALDMPTFTAAFPHDAIYLLHYPGFSGSTGVPTEQSIRTAALALFDFVHADHPNVILVGRSLGTGPAVRVASERPVFRLVLVSPYDSLADAAATVYPYIPVRLLLLDKFDSGRYASQVTAPTRIIAAQNDALVPLTSSERLRARFRPGVASFVVIPNTDHITVSESPGYLSLLQGR